jgi:hypothetical protein
MEKAFGIEQASHRNLGWGTAIFQAFHTDCRLLHTPCRVPAPIHLGANLTQNT